MLFFYSIFGLFYTGLVLTLISGLKKIGPCVKNRSIPFTSVIIPARNEEKNIQSALDALLYQDLDATAYEIIVVDDNSTDGTAKILQEYGSRHSNIRCFYIKSCPPGWTPKKYALQTGIDNSRGEIILTTDADCIMSREWVSTMARSFTENVGTVSSWVFIETRKDLLSRLETLDSLSLVLVGAAAIGLGRPVLANGANFGYRKSLFHAIDGFEKNRGMASGDDDLFVQNVYNKTKFQSIFITNPKAGIYTHANLSWKDFFRQRFRWASKSPVYPVEIIFGEILIYVYNVFLLFSLFLAFCSPFYLLPLLLKYILDLFFMAKGCKMAGRKWNPFLLFLTELLQMIYIITAGFIGLFGRYSWKGRYYHKSF